jgi:hypothetical protein
VAPTHVIIIEVRGHTPTDLTTRGHQTKFTRKDTRPRLILLPTLSPPFPFPRPSNSCPPLIDLLPQATDEFVLSRVSEESDKASLTARLSAYRKPMVPPNKPGWEAPPFKAKRTSI